MIRICDANKKGENCNPKGKGQVKKVIYWNHEVKFLWDALRLNTWYPCVSLYNSSMLIKGNHFTVCLPGTILSSRIWPGSIGDVNLLSS